MKHVMLDLETLGTAPDAMILSVGAVRFDPYGSSVSPTTAFHRGAGTAPQPRRTADLSTVQWWMSEAQAPGRRALHATSQAASLHEMLMEFCTWFGDARDTYVWGNGAAFDNVLLRHALVQYKIEPPWTFRQDRCFRTLKALAPNIPFDGYGTAHSAVDDAIAQALHLQKITRQLRLATPIVL